MLRRIIAVISLLFLLQINASAQSFTIKKYLLEDGLPDRVIYDVIQDSTGRLWCVSERGLFNYDAYEWKLQKSVANDLQGFYRYVSKDKENNLWFASWYFDAPFLKYNNGVWDTINPDPDIGRISIISFEALRDGDKNLLACGVRTGLLYYNGNNWERLTTEDGLPDNYVMSVSKHKNEFVIGTINGPVILKDGKIEPLFSNVPELMGEVIFASYVETHKGKTRYWFLGKNFVGKYYDGKYEIVNSSFSFPMYNIKMEYFLISDGKERLYLGNQATAFWIDLSTGNLNSLSNEKGVLEKGITNAVIDFENNIWISSKRGLMKIKPSPFLNYYEQDGLNEGEVSSINAFNNGTMVIGHNNSVTMVENGQVVKTYTYSEEKTQHSRYRVLDSYSSGEKVYLALSDMGLAILDKNYEMELYPPPPSAHFSSITKDCDDRILLGGNRGLFQFQGNYFTRIDTYSGITQVSHYIRKILIDKDCDLMLATMNSGLVIPSTESLVNIKGDNALAGSVYDMVITNQGEQLVGTMGGLYEIIDNKLQKFIIAEEFIENPIYFLKRGSDDDIWLGTNSGLIKYDGKSVKRYGLEEGISGLELNRDAAYLDTNNNFWVGTDQGLSRYIPEYDYETNYIPNVEFVALEDASGESFSLDEDLYLESNQNNLWLNFRGLSFTDENKNRFYIEIYDIESGKSEIITTKENYFRFANLDPGQYYFTLKFKNSRGIYSNTIKSNIITINRPFYSQLWFYFMIAVFGSSFLYLFLDIYYNRKQSRELENRVAERTEELVNSEKKYRQLVETALDAIISTDVNFNIITWNEAAERIYGFSKNDVLGKNFLEVTKVKYEKLTGDEVFERFKKIGFWQGEIVQSNRNGDQINALISVSVYKELEGEITGLVGVCRDITAAKKYEMEKSFAVLDSVEKERDRISKDLHDDLGQILTSAKYKLETFEFKSKIHDKFFEDALTLIHKAGKELRNIVHNLRPSEIDNYGLISAVDLLIYQNQRISDIKIELSKKEYDNELSKDSELMLYRIIQEGINNALKHSEAKIIQVSLERFNNSLLIEIVDNGRGFDIDSVLADRVANRGNGLLNIYHRAELLGGELKVLSEHNSGTKLQLKINLN